MGAKAPSSLLNFITQNNMVKFFKNNLQSIFTVILMILFISDTNFKNIKIIDYIIIIISAITLTLTIIEMIIKNKK